MTPMITNIFQTVLNAVMGMVSMVSDIVSFLGAVLSF